MFILNISQIYTLFLILASTILEQVTTSLLLITSIFLVSLYPFLLPFQFTFCDVLLKILFWKKKKKPILIRSYHSFLKTLYYFPCFFSTNIKIINVVPIYFTSLTSYHSLSPSRSNHTQCPYSFLLHSRDAVCLFCILFPLPGILLLLLTLALKFVKFTLHPPPPPHLPHFRAANMAFQGSLYGLPCLD